MRKFTEDDFNKVKMYESKFESAIKSRFVSGMSQEGLTQVSTIFRETLNRQANLSCGGCVLNMMTSVGRMYFAYKEEREREKEMEDQKEKETKKRNTKSKGKEVDVCVEKEH